MACYQIRSTVLARRIEDEVVVLDLDAGSYFGLDEVAAAIWELLPERAEPEAIASVLHERYDVELERAMQDVTQLLHTLVEMKLVERVDPQAG